jgi:hypothetical protein
MQTSNVYEWIAKEESHRKILTALKMPLTAKQLARKTGIPVGTCSYIVAKFTLKGIFTCLNQDAQNSRVYWLTELGISCQKQFCQDLNIPYKEYDLHSVNWALLGWVCFSHRSIVIKTLNMPMQPAEIKKQIRLQKTDTKISANNIRDVIKLFLAKGIVQPVKIRKKAHPRYELTELGIKLRQLLIQAESIN